MLSTLGDRLAGPLDLLTYLLRWMPVGFLAGVLAGCASALLIWLLNVATSIRESHVWIIALLPLAGMIVALMYRRFGPTVNAGNDLILQEIHGPRATLPFRMTPLILISTFLTHLFGGSAGREGTALQTGASLADQLGRPFRMNPQERRILLMAGVSGGFGSVFGTPLAGTFFGMEVLTVGTVTYEAILPCLIASFTGDVVTHLLGAHEALYHVAEPPPIALPALFMATGAGAIFGLTAMLFSRCSHLVSGWLEKYVSWPPLRPFAGGALIAAAVFLLHTTRYIGLGVPTINAAFTEHLPPWDFAMKFLFTVVTLGSGFKGGEVTPLFFVGATLGNALAYILPLPPSLLAGMGFVAVFAGAANAPIASTLMAVELFGARSGPYAAVACIFSYLFSGHAGIYHSQRIGTDKFRWSRQKDTQPDELPGAAIYPEEPPPS